MVKIKPFRTDYGLSQEAVARAISVSRATVASWERGDTEPMASQVVKLAELFGVSTDKLLGV